MTKPRVITNCVANSYTMDGERIIEFSDRHVPCPDSGVTGGLISFRRQTPDAPDGVRLTVGLYALSGPIDVLVEGGTPVYINGKLITTEART